jgi:starch synthase
MEMVIALQKAIVLFKDSKKVNQLRKLMMGLDFSWNKSALEYHQLYNSLTKT